MVRLFRSVAVVAVLAASASASVSVAEGDPSSDSSSRPSLSLSGTPPLCLLSPDRCLRPWPAPPEGWIRIEDVPAVGFPIDTIAVEVRDAFDDTEVKGEADRMVLGLTNHLHWETRPSVVRKCLPFAPGDTVTGEELLEGIRLLRQQKFFSDAELELWQHADGRRMVRVVTGDQFTLSVPLSLSRPDNRWLFSIGLLEFNLLGTGNELGGMYQRTTDRDIYLGFFRMPHFLIYDQRLEFNAARNSDGYSGSAALYRPFTRLDTKWAWSAEAMVRKFDDRWIIPRDKQLQPVLVEDLGGIAGEEAWLVNPKTVVSHGELRGIEADSATLRIAYASGGDRLKSYLRLGWDRWSYGLPERVDTTLLAIPRAEGDTVFGRAPLPTEWWSRTDSRIGMRHTVKSFRYTTVRNFRGARWNEDLELGWTLYNGVSRNIAAWGADRDEWRIEHSIRVQELWKNRFLWLLDGYTFYYWGEGEVSDGFLSALSDFTWKHGRDRLSTTFLVDLKSYYADREEGGARQLRLGGHTGMDGFPVDWMAGRSTLFASLEERWRPGFEFGTVVPLVAAFARAGGAWSGIDRIDLQEMEFSVGTGLRVVMSKSVRGMVNYIDLSWPLNGPLADGFSGWRFSLTAHTSL